MRVVIFSGTSDGRALSRALAALGALVTVCVATDYGREEQGEAPGITVHSGRLDAEAMAALLQGTALCIDATHPYATEATEHIRAAAAVARVPYRRLLRRESPIPEGSTVVAGPEDAVRYLAGTDGNILLTTGSKTLPLFAALGGQRLYPRVLPQHDSLTACEAAGIPHRNIVAMQGPFSTELNLALIRQFQIKYLVTKDGGPNGGFAEKAAAAEAGGAALVVLRRPADSGEDFETILQFCREMLA